MPAPALVTRFIREISKLEDLLLFQFVILGTQSQSSERDKAEKRISDILTSIQSASIFFSLQLSKLYMSDLQIYGVTDVPVVFEATEAYTTFVRDVSKAIQSVRMKIKKVRSAPVATTSLDTYKQQLAKSLVSVSNGASMWSFSLSYYLGMVATYASSKIRTEASVTAVKSMDADLVQISPNPSTIGDYCDAYRGKVFSVSGESNIFPALSQTPSGGPPFHHWCHHFTIPFSLSSVDSQSLLLLSDVDTKYLLKKGETDHKRILKAWYERDQT